jgi:hypothetical protein
MSQVKGTQSSFALFEEDTFGSDPTTPDGQKMYCTSFGVQMTRSLQQSATLSGNRGMEKPVQGNIDVGGSIASELSGQEMGTLLKHSLGTNATTGAGPYVHTMTCGDLPTGLTLEKDHGSVISGTGRYEKFNGCRVGSIGFEFPQEGFPTVSVDVVGANSVYAGSALDATVTDNGHTSFGSADMAITEGGSTIAYVKSASISLSNELDSSGYVIGSSARRAIPEGQSAITGSITALFESMDLLNKARNNTASSLVITVSRGDGLGSSGNEQIKFTVQQLDFETSGSPIEGPAGVEITLPFTAYKSGSDLGLEIELKNAVATI